MADTVVAIMKQVISNNISKKRDCQNNTPCIS